MTVLTRDEGDPDSGTEIIIEETDDLVVFGRQFAGNTDLGPIGLSSAHGEISVTLLSADARLTLATGVIETRAPGMDIRLEADDFDFISAPIERIDPLDPTQWKSYEDAARFPLPAPRWDSGDREIDPAYSDGSNHVGGQRCRAS